MDFGLQPEDLDYSLPLEPMQLKSMRGQQDVLKNFLSELVDTHPTKLTKDQRDDVRGIYRQILLNVIYNSFMRIYSALPRGANAFQEGGYWNKLGLTYRFTVAVLDRLVADGYIFQMKGVYNGPGGFSRLTRIFGSAKLADTIDVKKLIASVEFLWDDDAAPVVLTNFPYKADVLDDDHPDVMRIKAIIRFLKHHAWMQKGPIRIIYKNNPMYGGRVYARFQNLKKEFRREMMIDGKSTVELDYKSNHLMMLIAMQGLPLPADPYRDVADRAGVNRDDVKAFATKAIGANSQVSGFRAMYQDRYKKDKLLRIKDSMLELYPGIRLFIGLGAALQTLEGQIALDIMYAGAKAGIVVLPVHDSFITTAENKDWLREQMTVQWANHVKEGALTRINMMSK